MTVAEVFKMDADPARMVDTMYDLFITARLPFGVAELQDGRQLFVLPSSPGIRVTEEDVLYELSAYLIDDGNSIPKMGMEIKNAIIDIFP